MKSLWGRLSREPQEGGTGELPQLTGAGKETITGSLSRNKRQGYRGWKEAEKHEMGLVNRAFHGNQGLLSIFLSQRESDKTCRGSPSSLGH